MSESLFGPRFCLERLGEELIGKPRPREPSHRGRDPAQPRARDDQGRARVVAHTVLSETLDVLGHCLPLQGWRFFDVGHVDDPGHLVARTSGQVFAYAKRGTELFVGGLGRKRPSINGLEVTAEPGMVVVIPAAM